MKHWFSTKIINNNYVSSCILGTGIILWLYITCYIAAKSNLFVSIDNITKSTLTNRILFDFFTITLLAFIIIIFNRKKRKSYRLCIESKYEILILSGIMILLFFLHKDYSIEGFYLFVFYLFFVAFTEEFIFRGYLYNRMCKDSRITAIIISGFFFGIGHAVLPSVMTNADVFQLLLAMASEVCGGVIIGWYFIVLQERSKTIWIPVLIHAILDYTVGIIGVLVAVVTLIYFLDKTKPKSSDVEYNKLMN